MPSLVLQDADIRALFEHAPYPLCVADPECRFLAANRALERVFRCPSEEILGQPLVEFIHPEDLPETAVAFSRALSGEPVDGFVSRCVRKDGTDFWLEWSSSPSLKGTVCFAARDVTRDVLVTRPLELQRNLLARAEAIAHLGSWRHDLKTDTYALSEEACRILGIPPGDFDGDLGTALKSVMHPADKERAMAIVDAALLGEAPHASEHRILRRDGEVRVMHIDSGRETDAEGKAIAATGFLQDVTERRAIEHDLGEAVMRFERMIDGTIRLAAGFVEKRDPYTAGHQERVSRLAVAICKEIGMTTYETKGIRIAALLHDIGKIAVPAEILTTPRKLSELEWEMIRLHPFTGANMLKGIEFNWPIGDAVAQHHERLDGSGYDRGLVGDQVCVSARVIAVADVAEAMLSHRPYRPALTLDEVVEELTAPGDGGPRYDAGIANACIALLSEGRFAF